jgi:hypothetical protein
MIRLPLTHPIVRTLALQACLLAAAAPHAAAQDADPSSPPAHLSRVDGPVVVQHEDGPEDADLSMPVVPGDRLRTGDGRAEVTLTDGTLVQIDAASTLDLLADDRLRLLEGRLAIVATRAQAAPLQVDTPQGTVSIDAAGEYRLRLMDADGRDTLELSVIRGQAELTSDQDRVTVSTGERSWARTGEVPAYPVRFNAAALDAFDQWALDRAMERRGGATSARYVPSTLRSYADALDTYGSWDHEPTYGYVWYPRVEAGWSPSHDGRWRHDRRYGWTVVGGGAWGWPTHHYGRWQCSARGAWFWIPGARWKAASGSRPVDGRRADDTRATRRFTVGSRADRSAARPLASPWTPAPHGAGLATRLPGDLGSRPAPTPSAGGVGPTATTGRRPQPNATWRADQVPVHRGGRVTPSPTEPSRTGPRTNAAPAASGAIAPGGDSIGWPTPGARSRGEGAASTRSGAGLRDRAQGSPRVHSPQAMPPPRPPPAIRQAPSGGQSGNAVPRGGPPPSRHR